MNQLPPWAKRLAAAALAALYLVLSFLAGASNQPPLLAVVVSLAPMAFMALVFAWHQSGWKRSALLTLWGVLVLGVATQGHALTQHVAAVFFLQHVGAMGFLGLMFGHTLGQGHDRALCSRIATFVTPEPLDARYLRYTWQVTWVWTLFFVLMFVLSTGLFLSGRLWWWSLLANVLTPAGVGGLFVVEYLVRLRVLPDRPHMDVRQTIQAYQRFRQAQR